MKDAELRPLPPWGWVLAVLFFPCGIFGAFGCARLLPWSKAVAGALLSYGCVVGFAWLMGHWESIGASALIRSLTLLGGALVFNAWGWVLYAIGRRADFWSSVGRSAWAKAQWLGYVALGVAGVGVVLQLMGRSAAA